MIHIPRGTQDILPEETTKWRYIENQLHKLMEVYNYQEIRTPIFESTDLFARGVGTLPMLYKRKCTRSKIKVIVVLRYVLREQLRSYVAILKIKCKAYRTSR